MKKLYYTAAIVITAAFTVGCGNKPIQPVFETIKTDSIFKAGNANYNISYEFTSVANSDKSPALQAIEEANIAYFFGLEGFTGKAQEAVPQAVAMTVENSFDTLDNEREWEATSTVTSRAAIVDTLVSYTITSSGYLGGAHGYSSVNSHNYSIAGGYELSLIDLFSAEQQEKLLSMIRQKLYEQYNVSDDHGLAEQGFFPEYLAVTENFEVTSNGIVFHYNPYDIGCYALGGIDIEIIKSELNTL